MSVVTAQDIERIRSPKIFDARRFSQARGKDGLTAISQTAILNVDERGILPRECRPTARPAFALRAVNLGPAHRCRHSLFASSCS